MSFLGKLLKGAVSVGAGVVGFATGGPSGAVSAFKGAGKATGLLGSGKAPSPVQFINKPMGRRKRKSSLIKNKFGSPASRLKRLLRERGLTPALPQLNKPLSRIQRKVFNKPTTLTRGQRRRRKSGKSFVKGLPNLGIGGRDPSDVQFTKPGFSIFGKRGTESEATNKKIAVAGGVGLGVLTLGITLLRAFK